MDIPTTPPGISAEERARIHAEHFATFEAKRAEERRPQHDEHVSTYRAAVRKLEFANELAARCGRLPLTMEQILDSRPATTPPDAVAEFKKGIERRKERFERMCPPLFAEAWDWEKVKPAVAHAEVKKIFGWQFGPRGLYVAGESGHSKTRALWCLVRRLVIKEQLDVLVLDGIAFSNLCTRAFGDPANTEQLFRPLLRADVLAIDDLAKRWTPATEEGAFMVLDRRTAHQKPVLATLNYTTDDLHRMQEARGDLAALRDVSTPLIRRLVDYCEPVVL
jgi:hypothetical protein